MNSFDDVFIISEKLEAHPIALLIPEMDEEAFQKLKTDILGNGLLDPIILFQGKILDGRHRYKACIENGIEVFGRQWEGGMDPVEYVVSKNIHRRHLTVGQKALAAQAMMQYIEEDAKRKQREAGAANLQRYHSDAGHETTTIVPAMLPELIDEPIPSGTETREKAGKLFGVAARSVSEAKVIVENGTPDEIQSVQSGKKPLHVVSKKVRERVRKEKAVIDPKPSSKKPSYEVDDIGNGLYIQRLQSENKPSFNETNENIEWAKWSWNPVTGCLHGCPYCYAKAIAENERYSNTFRTQFKPTFHPNRLAAPSQHTIPHNRQNEPGIHNVFLCSMADLFGDWVPNEWITQIFDVIRSHTEYNFIALTKNPKRYLELEIPDNIWIGATADTQRRFDDAIAVMQNINRNGIKFLSCEPLLEEITYTADQVGAVNWVIIGGLKGSEHKDSQPQWKWVERLIGYARRSRASVYFKTNLTVRPKELPQGG